MAVTGSTVAGQIDDIFALYGGRPATSAENTIWAARLQAGTATLDSLKTAVIDSTPLGGTYLPTLIRQTFQDFGGRAPSDGETATWIGWMRNQGATPDSLKTAVIDATPLGGTYLPALIRQTFQDYGGRASTDSETSTWLGWMRNQGATPDSLKKAVIDALTLGASYLPGLIQQTFRDYGGVASTTAETATWVSWLRGGATLDGLKKAVIDAQGLGATYLPTLIRQTFQDFGGRAPSDGETATWIGWMRNQGATPDSLKTAVIDATPLGGTYLPALIRQTFQDYGGRASTDSETSTWLGWMRNQGATPDSLKKAVIDALTLGASYLPGLIQQTFRDYGGVASTTAETATWVSWLRGGATLDGLKKAVIDAQGLGATYLPTLIRQTFQDFGGRAPSDGETATWIGWMRNQGATPDSLKTAVIDATPLGGTYLPALIRQTFQDYGGRASTDSETSTWLGWMRNQGATPLSLKLAILGDPLGTNYATSQLTAYFGAHGLGAPSNTEIQSLLTLLRNGSSYVDAEAAVGAAHVVPSINPIETAIYEAFGTYAGRAPTATEVDQWTHSLTSTSTAAAQLRASLLPSTDGQAHLAAQITAEFQQWGGRAPTSAELTTWKSAIQDSGAVPDAIRVSILGTSLGQPQASAAIAAEYQEYFGRAATTAELQASLATLAATHDYAATHQALFTAPESILHFYDTLHTLYTSLLGHDYTSADQSKWFDQIFFKNATYATMRATLMVDPTSLGAQLAGTSAADTITIHGTTGETTISNFNAAVDKVKLDTAVYGGTNLLDAAHAREVTSTDGVTPNVLITIDANDHILLHGVNLAELSASNFLFG